MSDTLKKNWFARHKVATGFLVLLFLFIIGSGGDDTSKKTTTDSQVVTGEPVKANEEVLKVSAYNLSVEYEKNGISADLKYKGKVVDITGVVDSVGADIVDSPYVVLAGSKAYEHVQCYLNRSKPNLEKAASLNKGMTVTLRSVVDGKTFNVIGKDCVIQ